MDSLAHYGVKKMLLFLVVLSLRTHRHKCKKMPHLTVFVELYLLRERKNLISFNKYSTIVHNLSTIVEHSSLKILFLLYKMDHTEEYSKICLDCPVRNRKDYGEL